MRYIYAGELSLCMMICVDVSMDEVGTEGGTCEATMMLVSLCRIPRTALTKPTTRSGLSIYL